MISGGLLILFIGLIASESMVAFSDMRYRVVNEKLWLPAIIAAAYFYATSGLVVQVYVLPFILASSFAGGLVFAAFHKKGFGGADLIAIMVASTYPFLLLFGVVPGMVFSYMGLKLHLWGGNGVPVAGLIGLFSAVILILFVFV